MPLELQKLSVNFPAILVYETQARLTNATVLPVEVRRLRGVVVGRLVVGRQEVLMLLGGVVVDQVLFGRRTVHAHHGVVLQFHRAAVLEIPVQGTRCVPTIGY